MANKEQPYVQIGHTMKAHGITGEIKFFVEDDYLEDFLKNERIFLEVRNLKVPYFIAQVRGKGDLIVKLEEVGDRDAAQMLQSKKIFLREQDLLADHEREFETVQETLVYARLTGYRLRDKSLGDIGVIDEILEMPQQEMAFLRYKNREVLIPIHENLILSIDDRQKTIEMDLPEGLLSD